jgi:hypothetical protein
MPPTLTPMTVRGGQPITPETNLPGFLQIAFLEKQLILVFPQTRNLGFSETKFSISTDCLDQPNKILFG